MLRSTAYQLLSYDTTLYPFRDLVTDLFDAGPLEDLADASVPRLTRQTDQSLEWQRIFYRDFKLRVWACYFNFVTEVIRPWFEEAIVYQAVPTFRVQLRENLAVGEWHRDAAYGHALHELNFWLPLTDAWGSNSVWIENGSTFEAATVLQGQLAVFEGARRLHGNVPNVTGQTRVSFDFRAYPRRLHTDRDVPAINGKRRFVLGDYWAELP